MPAGGHPRRSAENPSQRDGRLAAVRLAAAFLAILPALLTWSLPSAQAQSAPQYFRIGTGGQSGTYFPVGRLIAEAISDVPKGPNCAESRCGVPGLVAVAQTSNGSVANVAALQAGEIEAALAQADVVQWAFEGQELYAGKPRLEKLRFVAHLYSEAMHVVVRKQAGIRSISDLRDRAAALDEPGSGTLVHVRNLLRANGLTEADLHAEYIKPDLALPRMKQGKLDAFFIVAGWPAKAVVEALESGYADILPLGSASSRALIAANPFLTHGEIPAGAYAGEPAIPTLMVGAQLIVRADLPDDTVAGVLSALWSDRGKAILRKGHPRGSEIRISSALAGRGIPLHPGAERFYRQLGLLPG